MPTTRPARTALPLDSASAGRCYSRGRMATSSQVAIWPNGNDGRQKSSGGKNMKWLFSAALVFALGSAAHCQDSPFRKELKRADLTGTNMEVITSINEVKPGETSALHIHHGEESFYVIEGGMVELPDGKQVPFPAGTTATNRREVPHGAFKVVGDKVIKYLSVHIVDKGKPLYDTPK
jgi:mannose-6-phosphate isomerase-like protein (cupin superfamily)